jgi:hypothetical protein
VRVPYGQRGDAGNTRSSRVDSLALAAGAGVRGFEDLDESLLIIGMELVEDDAGDINPVRRPASPN